MENTAVIAQTPKVPAREIGVVTAEIKQLRAQAQQTTFAFAIEIGRRLVEAKAVLVHGEWGDWLRNEVEFSQSTADNLMKLFKEYGNEQISIFGAVANSQTIQNLPYTKALQLLAVPAEEREEFALEVDAEHISVKELQTAIKERNDAIERQRELEQACSHAEIARDAAERKAAEADELRVQIEDLTKSLNDTVERERKAKEKLKAAQNDPKLPPEKLQKIKDEAEAEAKKKASAEIEKELAELKTKAERAEADKTAALARVEEAERMLTDARTKLKTASPEVSAFKVLFDSMQETARKAKKMIETIGEGDPETAEKLKKALEAFGASLSL